MRHGLDASRNVGPVHFWGTIRRNSLNSPANPGRTELSSVRCAGEALLPLRVDPRRHSAQAASRDAAERDRSAPACHPAAAVDHRPDVPAARRVVCRLPGRTSWRRRGRRRRRRGDRPPGRRRRLRRRRRRPSDHHQNTALSRHT